MPERVPTAVARLCAPWLPLLGKRYAIDIARRQFTVIISVVVQLVLWVTAWAFLIFDIGPYWIFLVLILAPAAVTMRALIQLLRFGAEVRRDLAQNDIHVREILYVHRPRDVEQWAFRNNVDLRVVARIGDDDY